MGLYDAGLCMGLNVTEAETHAQSNNPSSRPTVSNRP